jgi:hypothetical protein
LGFHGAPNAWQRLGHILVAKQILKFLSLSIKPGKVNQKTNAAEAITIKKIGIFRNHLATDMLLADRMGPNPTLGRKYLDKLA